MSPQRHIFTENLQEKTHMITHAILLNANDTVGSNNLYEENKHFLCRGWSQLSRIAGRAYLCADNALENPY